MTPSTDLAVGLVGAWVRLYTAGLPPGTRDARRAELDSDLWEHRREPERNRESAGETARAMLGRCLRGIPADLSWRLQLKGDGEMRAKALVERGAGLLMMLVVAFLVTSLFSGVGTGGALEYFKDDFPNLAANLDRFATALLLQAIASGVMICAAAALYLTFRPHEPALATFGAFLLLAAGVLFFVGASAGRAIHDLAREWGTGGGAPGDPVWAAARAVTLIYEFLGFAAAGLIVASFAAFGGVVALKAPMPRWLGAPAVLGGVLLLLSVLAHSEASWGFLMGGFLLGMIWLVSTAVWLLWRGTQEPARPSPA